MTPCFRLFRDGPPMIQAMGKAFPFSLLFSGAKHIVHHIFRETVRRFVDREIVPFHAQWEKDGIVPRGLWLKAGAEGLLCCTVPEQYGGMGLDYLFDVIVFEELWRVGASGPGFLIHTDLVATYLVSFGT